MINLQPSFTQRRARFRFLLTSAIVIGLAGAGRAQDRTVLPIQTGPFTGVISESVEQSKPSWPRLVTAPAGAPNVLLVMTDDVGFGAASTFGGPIPTPNLDRIAARGLRYTNFFTTAICSPSRAALLTGRNHHMVDTGHLVDVPEGFPGYDSIIPRSAATIGRVLGGNGYSTAFFGKHHNVPITESSGAGPFDNWPTGLGFDYFYGFIGYATDQWHPALFRGTTRVDESSSAEIAPLDKRLADDALLWIHNQKAAAPDRPFFIYYAPGSTHAPHQAPIDWIARFHGKFDAGWDQIREQTFLRQKRAGLIPPATQLTARPDPIPAWDSLSPAMKAVNARDMEVYAAQLAYQDAQLGRIIDELQRMGQLDNTLVIFVEGDNGASAESGPTPTHDQFAKSANALHEDEARLTAKMIDDGGPKADENYSVGWAYAMNTPFKWFKQIASYEGGTHTGMVVSWPKGIPTSNEMRTHFTYLTDVMPTILEATHIPAPKIVDGAVQQRLDGVSLVPGFANAKADDHQTQYFEIAGNKAIYHEGWMASTTPRVMPWGGQPLSPIETPATWELYDLRSDFSQARNVAASNPAKLTELIALWDQEARRNNVYPVDERPMAERGAGQMQLYPNANRSEFTYWSAGIRVSQLAAPNFAARSFVITAEIDTQGASASGVLLATGSWFGGWSFYLKNGCPIAVEAASSYPNDQFKIAATEPIPSGKSTITYTFTSDGGLYSGGKMAISVNGRSVASGRIGRTIAIAGSEGETFDIGKDTGVPVTDDYDRNAFSGAIDRVGVKLSPPVFVPPSTRRSKN